MSNPNPNNATVQHTVFRGRSVAECLADVGTVCTAGAQSTQVQNAPPAQQALVVLQKAVTTADASLANKLALVQALLAAMKTLEVDFTAVRVATVTYEAAVNALAAGDATVITKAGLLARDTKKTPAAALGRPGLSRCCSASRASTRWRRS